jgi:TfoX/Sxy family transcriptional regulator of competence genes
MTPEELFEAVVAALPRDSGLSRAKMFGSPGLKAGAKMVACLVKGRLVVKLPQARVEAIVALGNAEHFDPGMGRLMKEWAAVAPGTQEQWLALVLEARDFVATAPPSKKR